MSDGEKRFVGDYPWAPDFLDCNQSVEIAVPLGGHGINFTKSILETDSPYGYNCYNRTMKFQRIIILGASGSGKSTLANRIGTYTNCLIYHLDNLLVNQDWSQKEKSEWLGICTKEFLSKDIGIVDGHYSFVLEERMKWADFIRE